MNALDAPNCAQCKAAPAALFLIFTTTEHRGVSLPYCERCGFEIAPVLVANGYEVTLTPATTPPWLLICEYGEDCPRTARRGFRMCRDHLLTLEEVYAGKESGASVDQADDVAAGREHEAMFGGQR